jgi:hypothetical protein
MFHNVTHSVQVFILHVFKAVLHCNAAAGGRVTPAPAVAEAWLRQQQTFPDRLCNVRKLLMLPQGLSLSAIGALAVHTSCSIPATSPEQQ